MKVGMREGHRGLRALIVPCCAALLALGTQAGAQTDDSAPAIAVSPSPSLVTFAGGTAKSAGRLKVRINGPDGRTVYETVSEGGLVDWVPQADLPDGRYRWDVWFVPQAVLDRPRVEDAAKAGTEPTTAYRSGSFRLQGGYLVMPDESAGDQQAGLTWPERALGTVLEVFVAPAHAGVERDDFVQIADTEQDNRTELFFFSDTEDEWYVENLNGDLRFGLILDLPHVTMESSGEVGIGTTQPQRPLHFFADEPFIRFAASGTPQDWELRPDHNGVRWVDQIAGTTPMVIDTNAPTNSLFLESSTGDIGLGTSTPSSTLHIVDSSPGVRLEKVDGSAWTILGGASFTDEFRVTESGEIGSPFTIQSGAPNASLDIEANGNMGVGTATPGKRLHVRGNSADTLGQNNTMMQVENVAGSQGPRRMIELINNGSPLLVYKDTARGTTWNMSPVGNSFVISLSGSGAQEFQMDGNGNAEFQGDVTANGVVLDSSRELKTDFAAVDGQTILSKMARLDVSQWRYKDDTTTERHIGPMAEDFQRVFGLGDGRHIELVDTTGITIAAIKALEADNRRKASEIAELKDRVAQLEQAVAE